LQWFAARMPSCINPDHLTLLGFGAMAAAGACYAASRWWGPALLLVNVCLAVNWFGDSLDGTVARVRDQQRPRYGYYVDHVIDLAGSVAMLIGMEASDAFGCSEVLGMPQCTKAQIDTRVKEAARCAVFWASRPSPVLAATSGW
jgi:phosphatidylglycerophosphate synthase